MAQRPFVIILAILPVDVNTMPSGMRDATGAFSILLEERDQASNSVPDTVLDRFPLGEDIEER